MAKTWMFPVFIFYLICISNISKVGGASAESESDEEDFLLDVEDYNTTTYNRDGRVFPWLAVVRLPPQTCTSLMGNTMTTGVCRTKKQCSNLGGTESGGSCGSGYGVCCMITQSCQGGNNGRPIEVTSTGTHITQPTSYTPPLSCRFSFPRPAGVCQVRLDFNTFRLAGPNAEGDCNQDSFTVAGADNLNQFITCGINSGQHLYLHYGSADTISATINAISNMASYDILVNYIRCSEDGDSDRDINVKRKGKKFDGGGSGNKRKNNNNNNNNGTTLEPAPPGCSQYYTTTSGTVRSFNYVQTDDMMAAANPVQNQINNEMYTVCVKTLSGTDMITWMPCSGANAANPNGNSFCITQQPGSPGLTGDACITDYVDIPGSPNGRYCGCGFPATVPSMAKPYILYVNFNDGETFGANFPLNPATGCVIGAMCTWFGQEVMPGQGGAPPTPVGAILPCNDPMAVQQGQQCVSPPFFGMNSDVTNPGFCLRYTVM